VKLEGKNTTKIFQSKEKKIEDRFFFEGGYE
jgi:hypothetical protein